MKSGQLTGRKTADSAVKLSKPAKVKLSQAEFEKKAIGAFVLKLYHDLHIQPNGNILKDTARREFLKYVKVNKYEADFAGTNIESLFRQHKLLLNFSKKSNTYSISLRNIVEFRENQKKSKILPPGYVGNFLLTLLHKGQIKKNGLISKSRIQNEFQDYLRKTQRKYEICSNDIGTLLYKNNFLWNTPWGSEYYCIKVNSLYMYRNEKLKELDALSVNNSSEAELILPEGHTNGIDKPLESSAIEVLPNAEELPVLYEGGCEQKVIPNFTVTSMGCYICQKNFKIQSDFEHHISIHGSETDFQFLSTCGKKRTNVFKLIYQLCNQSHYFNFTMKTSEKDLIVEKIIVVQTTVMHYVKNTKVPYEVPTVGIDSFLVDSHLFTIGVEQPIVVVYRYKFDKTTRYIEQHHFLRSEEFPKVHFTTLSTRVPYYDIMKTKFKLNDYYPSAEMKTAQHDNFSDESLCKVSEHVRKYLEERTLNSSNVKDIWNTLLQIEDLEGMRSSSMFHQEGAKIKRFGREYSVRLSKVPKGVFLEGIIGPLDEIVLIPATQDEKKKVSANQKKYFALIERVYYNQICFKYEKETICEYKKYDIIIRPSRLCLKYQYRAIEMLREQMIDYLYPGSYCNIQKNVLSTLDLELFNPQIQNNQEQLQAVRNIAEGPSSYAPYIIFGPPGTGKTTTIVEAVLQLWKRRPDSRILISAGSNGACDEVALRLCRVLTDIDPGKPNILRLFAKSNESRLGSIDDLLIDCSNFYRDHFYPSVKIIREYRIVVCTLSIVGKLVSAAIGKHFFTHIFIDECAASTEPETLVGFVGTSSVQTKLILSGDHKQLGPILRSTRAGELGLNTSIMERLLSLPCYAVGYNGDYDRSIQTRLVKNFRSHPEIIGLYNRLYYNDELKPMAKIDSSLWTLRWHLLPNKSYPIIFHSVFGSCNRGQRQSVSLSNEKEVTVVMDYVRDLMYFGINGKKIEETDIGIISPYKKQYTRIQEEINLRRWDQIEVGAVETFQGKEKPIIIVSTVRSFTKTLGFLDNPRRLNVMLSRAKSLLIMIGNPTTLSQNADFKFIIDECRERKCIIGGSRNDDSNGKLSNSSSTSELYLGRKTNNKPNFGSQELCKKLSIMSVSNTHSKNGDKEVYGKKSALKTQKNTETKTKKKQPARTTNSILEIYAETSTTSISSARSDAGLVGSSYETKTDEDASSSSLSNYLVKSYTHPAKLTSHEPANVDKVVLETINRRIHSIDENAQKATAVNSSPSSQRIGDHSTKYTRNEALPQAIPQYMLKIEKSPQSATTALTLNCMSYSGRKLRYDITELKKLSDSAVNQEFPNKELPKTILNQIAKRSKAAQTSILSEKELKLNVPQRAIPMPLATRPLNSTSYSESAFEYRPERMALRDDFIVLKYPYEPENKNKMKDKKKKDGCLMA